MTQKDKDLLLNDLCSRLPYKPMIRLDFQPGHGYQIGKMEIRNFENIIRHFESGIITTIKPYLRPMSSMTNKEQEEFLDLIICIDNGKAVIEEDKIDEYNNFIYSHYLDNKNFIENELALEALEGMYEF